ncbi:MAG: group 1 truncated hemoglobin [Burkholderiaceae bacterium]
MKKTFIAAALTLAAVFAGSVQAQTMGAMAENSAALYQAFGEKAGLVKLMDDFVPRLQADKRTATAFKDANVVNLKAKLVEQICQVSGGPCAYKGADMKSAHSSMDITKTDFNALVEVLQQAMDAQGIPFRNQNQLLAKLAPMHRDVITVK